MAGRKMCGGTSEVKNVTDEVKAFCEEVKEDVLKNLEMNAFDVFQPLHFKTQLVAGTNYFVKIQVNDAGECIHIRIFEPLPCNRDANSNKNVELTSVQGKKQVADEIEYF